MTAVHTALQSEIAALLVEALNLDIAPESIDPDAPLYGEGLGLDSIDALELGLALQRRYGVTVSADSEENRRHFGSVQSLVAFVQGHQAASRSGQVSGDAA